jgi:putative addiction module killer protein
VKNGNFGDCEPVGDGVSELKIHFGPGYRVYFGQDGNDVILLLGGEKKAQSANIKTAKEYWKDYNA